LDSATMTQATLWHADHVFLPPGRMSDLFLVQVVKPFLRDIPDVRAWFFIRYGERGPHLRIRIATADPAMGEIAHRHWRRCAPAFLESTPPGPEWRGSNGPHITPGSVLTIPYEAETVRYGGELAMPIGERAFCRSTALALGILAATPDDAGARIGQAMRLMLASASVLTHDRVAIGALFRAYAEGWRTHLAASGWVPGDAPVMVIDQDAVRCALEPEDRPTFGSTWVAWLREMIHALDAIGPLTASRQDIVMSQMHMLCNRLGVSPAMEFHLATQIGGIL